MTGLAKRALLIAVMLSAFATSLAAARVEKRTVTSRGAERTYYLFVPDGLTAEQPVPLVILLHGSGRRGASLVDPWKALARKERFIIAGPDSTNPRYWAPPEDGPRLLSDLAEALKKDHPIDPRRVYLFGHSAGGSFSLLMGLLKARYFAAVAVHAGALQPDFYTVTSHASRKIPFHLIAGTDDRIVPLHAVRGTRAALEKAGFPVTANEMPQHTHDYYGRAGAINADAWNFLRQHVLPDDPKLDVYRDM